MDWVVHRIPFLKQYKKYGCVLLAALTGILLMTLPEEKKQEQLPVPVSAENPDDLESSLSVILSQVDGAGEVQVLLTEKEGEQILFQCDEVRTQEDIRRDTVLISGSDRTEDGLVRQRVPPVYRGAVVLCRGADNAQVRLALAEAVKSVTGLSLDCITILKMK